MDDLISRQELIKLPRRKGYAVNGWETYIRVSDVKELPAVQPKERCIANITLNEEDLERIVKEQVEEIKDSLTRKGKWIRTRTMTHDGELYCDQCEQEHPEQKIIWSFCPNCGCRMEEGDSE